MDDEAKGWAEHCRDAWRRRNPRLGAEWQRIVADDEATHRALRNVYRVVFKACFYAMLLWSILDRVSSVLVTMAFECR